MKLSIESKFEIGNIVKIKGAEQKFLINNILSETCCGGTQILYVGIILLPSNPMYLRKDEEQKYLMDREARINETMLEIV